MDIEETIINLKVLEKLDKNQKLITRGAYLNIEPSSLIPECLRRWNRQDNRQETIKKINSVINSAITYLKSKSSCDESIFNVKEYLEKSLTGINNLKETYSICTQTCSRLDIIIDKINKFIEEG
uniref:Uncharacterized protein n=1 Tax=viral metagenome TaxID=1070528 RepID=A0A6C0EV09_9ZZZZ